MVVFFGNTFHAYFKLVRYYEFKYVWAIFFKLDAINVKY